MVPSGFSDLPQCEKLYYNVNIGNQRILLRKLTSRDPISYNLKYSTAVQLKRIKELAPTLTKLS